MDGVTAFDLLAAAVAVLAGAVAAVSGFGIGSLLTPTLALQLDPRLAVAVASLAHLSGTGLRFWMLRAHVDRPLLIRFGAASAAGSALGATAGAFVRPGALLFVLGTLLLVVGSGELLGSTRRFRIEGPWAWAAGGLSGLCGGLVGNQGPLRAAAMLGFPLSKAAFVSTATAIALVVDAARIPIYVLTDFAGLRRMGPLIGLVVAGVVAGTLAGDRLFAAVPERPFRVVVALLLMTLGVVVLGRAL